MLHPNSDWAEYHLKIYLQFCHSSWTCVRCWGWVAEREAGERKSTFSKIHVSASIIYVLLKYDAQISPSGILLALEGRKDSSKAFKSPRSPWNSHPALPSIESVWFFGPRNIGPCPASTWWPIWILPLWWAGKEKFRQHSLCVCVCLYVKRHKNSGKKLAEFACATRARWKGSWNFYFSVDLGLI